MSLAYLATPVNNAQATSDTQPSINVIRGFRQAPRCCQLRWGMGCTLSMEGADTERRVWHMQELVIILYSETQISLRQKEIIPSTDGHSQDASQLVQHLHKSKRIFSKNRHMMFFRSTVSLKLIPIPHHFDVRWINSYNFPRCPLRSYQFELNRASLSAMHIVDAVGP